MVKLTVHGIQNNPNVNNRNRQYKYNLWLVLSFKLPALKI